MVCRARILMVAALMAASCGCTDDGVSPPPSVTGSSTSASSTTTAGPQVLPLDVRLVWATPIVVAATATDIEVYAPDIPPTGLLRLRLGSGPWSAPAVPATPHGVWRATVNTPNSIGPHTLTARAEWDHSTFVAQVRDISVVDPSAVAEVPTLVNAVTREVAFLPWGTGAGQIGRDSCEDCEHVSATSIVFEPVTADLILVDAGNQRLLRVPTTTDDPVTAVDVPGESTGLLDLVLDGTTQHGTLLGIRLTPTDQLVVAYDLDLYNNVVREVATASPPANAPINLPLVWNQTLHTVFAQSGTACYPIFQTEDGHFTFDAPAITCLAAHKADDGRVTVGTPQANTSFQLEPSAGGVEDFVYDPASDSACMTIAVVDPTNPTAVGTHLLLGRVSFADDRSTIGELRELLLLGAVRRIAIDHDACYTIRATDDGVVVEAIVLPFG